MSVDISTDTTAAQLHQSEHGRQRARLVRDAPLISRGYTQITLASDGPQNLGQIPDGATMVWLNIESGSVRYRDDGNAADATTGMLRPIGTDVTLTLADLGVISICAATAPAVVNVTFYAIYS